VGLRAGLDFLEKRRINFVGSKPGLCSPKCHTLFIYLDRIRYVITVCSVALVEKE
jgi:hypothetical protein